MMIIIMGIALVFNIHLLFIYSMAIPICRHVVRNAETPEQKVNRLILWLR